MNEEKNNVVVREEIATPSMLDSLKNTENVFLSTIPNDGSRESQIKIYNAINGDGENLGDHLNKVIEVENFVAHPVQMVDDQTGEIIEALRIVLVTPTGETYASVANGVLSSIQKISGIIGSAPWTPALKLKAVEVKTRKGFKTMTLSLV